MINVFTVFRYSGASRPFYCAGAYPLFKLRCLRRRYFLLHQRIYDYVFHPEGYLPLFIQKADSDSSPLLPHDPQHLFPVAAFPESFCHKHSQNRISGKKPAVSSLWYRGWCHPAPDAGRLDNSVWNLFLPAFPVFPVDKPPVQGACLLSAFSRLCAGSQILSGLLPFFFLSTERLWCWNLFWGILCFYLARLLYTAREKGKLPAFCKWLAFLLIFGIYLYFLITKPTVNILGFRRPLIWGIPAALLVLAFFLLEFYVTFPPSMVLLGNSSFSIYLLHYYPVVFWTESSLTLAAFLPPPLQGSALPWLSASFWDFSPMSLSKDAFPAGCGKNCSDR